MRPGRRAVAYRWRLKGEWWGLMGEYRWASTDGRAPIGEHQRVVGTGGGRAWGMPPSSPGRAPFEPTVSPNTTVSSNVGRVYHGFVFESTGGATGVD